MVGYRYTTPAKGQYADGHEHEDVVFYRKQNFLPQWRKFLERMFNWVEGDLPELGPMSVEGHQVIAWFHNEFSMLMTTGRRDGTIKMHQPSHTLKGKVFH